MFAVVAARFDAEEPLSGLESVHRPAPLAPSPDWALVTVRAAALNHHDLWTLQGVGVDVGQLPLVLGSDGAGLDERGNRVVIHCVIGEAGHGVPPGECPSILADKYDGTFAEQVTVPRWNLLPIPEGLSFEEAACLPGAYLTAYRMLMVEAGAQPGDVVLVQGAGGGVATALILLGRAAGIRVWVTSRSEAKQRRALQLGADAAFTVGARLPARVDAVMETVGAATWSHSVAALRPRGVLVVAGATSGGDMFNLELNLIVERELRIVGTTLGSRDQLLALIDFCMATGMRPAIDVVLPIQRAREGFHRIAAGAVSGKIVFQVQ